jgi:tetraacyldisaccharide-1-P 4'-kinase
MASPYRLITSDGPCKTLAQGEVRCFASMLDAANAFVKAAEPYKTIVYDDGCRARELTRDESRLLAGTPQGVREGLAA